MKQLILSLTFLGSIFTVHAQIPDYFGNNPNWSENYYGGTPFTNFFAESSLTYMDGDSTIGSYTYHKLYKDGQGASGYTYPPTDNYFSYSHSLYMLVRQENRKIYYYDNFGQADELLISYEGPVGAYLEAAGSFGYEILAIDSVLIGSEYRRLLYIDTSDYPKFVVEGIGDIQPYGSVIHGGGLSTELFQSGIENFLDLCYGQNGLSLYPEASSGTMCHLTQVGLEEAFGSSIKITYNPSEELIQISGSEEDFLLTVWNSIGQAIVRANGPSISSSSIAAGVYIVTAENSKEFTSTRIVIAQ